MQVVHAGVAGADHHHLARQRAHRRIGQRVRRQQPAKRQRLEAARRAGELDRDHGRRSQLAVAVAPARRLTVLAARRGRGERAEAQARQAFLAREGAGRLDQRKAAHRPVGIGRQVGQPDMGRHVQRGQRQQVIGAGQDEIVHRVASTNSEAGEQHAAAVDLLAEGLVVVARSLAPDQAQLFDPALGAAAENEIDGDHPDASLAQHGHGLGEVRRPEGQRLVRPLVERRVVEHHQRRVARRLARPGQAMPEIGVEIFDACRPAAAVEALGRCGCQQGRGQCDDRQILSDATHRRHG